MKKYIPLILLACLIAFTSVSSAGYDVGVSRTSSIQSLDNKSDGKKYAKDDDGRDDDGGDDGDGGHSNVASGTCATCHNGTVAEGKDRGHITTTASCDTCHTTRAWEPAIGAGTSGGHSNVAPGTCATCHNGTSARGKNSRHIATTASCDTCHQTSGWEPATMGHSAVVPGTCATCHNGTTAQGKNSSHISTTASCDTCHKTTGWKPATSGHSNVTAGTCATCHNGTSATGKNTTHISTTASCDTCHQTTGWKPATVNHTNVAQGTCATCHNGTSATGKSITHISTTASCDSCHLKTAWKPATMNHSNVAQGTCATCHNGTAASGKSTTHIATTASCDTCHQTTAWKPATMSHTSVAPGTCATCHNGASAIGKGTTHISTTASCDSCHLSTAWKPATMSHTSVAPGTCNTCHNGTIASGRSSIHIPTTTSCDTCHLSTAWKPATMSHSNVAPGTCFSCHNGTSASGKITTHISTTKPCDTCHLTTAWKPATMDHSNVVKGTCATCHNGTGARGKSLMHTSTTASCDTCHLKTAWIPTTISTLDFPVEAVFSSLASTASTYTASTSDATGNSYLLSVNRSPGPDKTNTLIYPTPLKTYTQTKVVQKNGTVVSTDNSEVFYTGGPFSPYGNLNDLYGANNYMKVTTQFTLPATGRVGSSGVLYKGRNYLNNSTLSFDTWYGVWSLEADTPTSAWLCLSIDIAPANVAVAATSEMECYKLDQSGSVTGFKADTIEGGVNMGFGGDTAPVISSGDVAVEFYNANIDHYFMTASADEAVALDSNSSWGWTRTGNTLNVWLSQASAPFNALPVCRFYGIFANGTVGSHFYTVDAAECADVKSRLDWGWGYENDAYYAVQPAGGACPGGTSPIYRVYNNGMGGAPNHRYLMSQADVATMVSQGWGSEGTVLCGAP